jgi:hypothetical protein
VQNRIWNKLNVHMANKAIAEMYLLLKGHQDKLFEYSITLMPLRENFQFNEKTFRVLQL